MSVREFGAQSLIKLFLLFLKKAWKHTSVVSSFWSQRMTMRRSLFDAKHDHPFIRRKEVCERPGNARQHVSVYVELPTHCSRGTRAGLVDDSEKR
jgi:hypothetical protein